MNPKIKYLTDKYSVSVAPEILQYTVALLSEVEYIIESALYHKIPAEKFAGLIREELSPTQN